MRLYSPLLLSGSASGSAIRKGQMLQPFFLRLFHASESAVSNQDKIFVQYADHAKQSFFVPAAFGIREQSYTIVLHFISVSSNGRRPE